LLLFAVFGQKFIPYLYRPSSAAFSSSSIRLDTPSLIFSGGSVNVHGSLAAGTMQVSGALTAGMRLFV